MNFREKYPENIIVAVLGQKYGQVLTTSGNHKNMLHLFVQWIDMSVKFLSIECNEPYPNDKIL